MSKHTPGPWHHEIDTVFIRDGVSVQPVTHHMDSQGMADARLIAAAPDLLEALEAMLLGWETGRGYSDAENQIGKARAAIIKATGGTLPTIKE